MSDDIETTETPALCKAYGDAIEAHDRAAADLVLTAHGGKAGRWQSVPAARQEACTAALTRLATGKKADDDSVRRSLDRMRPAAFAALGTEAPKPAKVPTWDELQATAMKRFNNPPPVNRDDQ